MIGRLPMPQRERMRIRLAIWTALDLLARGRGTREEWSHCADALNIIEALCDVGKLDAREVMPGVCLAIDGLREAIRCEPGRMRVDEPYLLALRGVLSRYDRAVGAFSERTMHEATARAVVKIAAARCPNSDVEVMDG